MLISTYFKRSIFDSYPHYQIITKISVETYFSTFYPNHPLIPLSPPPQIDRQTFETTINKLNEYFVEADQCACSSYCEGFLACITAYLIYLCAETHYEKVRAPFIVLLVHPH